MPTTKELLALLRLLDTVPMKEKEALLSLLLALRGTEDTVTLPVSSLPKVKK